MATERGFGRTEIIIGVAVLVVVALIAIPLLMSSSTKSRRDEVALYVDAIRTAEITQMDAFDEYVSAEPAPRAPTAVDANAVPWQPTAGFVKLAWAPVDTDAVYGSYAVVATSEGFTVTGVCDIDGDGERAVFEATADHNARMITADDVY